MSPSHNKHPSLGRRSSLRRSTSLARAGSGAGADDDDEYDLSAMMVADGFRPADSAAPPSTIQSTFQPLPAFQFPSLSEDESQTFSSSTANSQSQSTNDHSSREGLSGMRIRPSSISKPPEQPHDALALRNDGSSTAAATQSRAARISSLSSDSPVIRLESPYRGPSGPSHPYQMYPQRTLSVTTTSTTATPTPADAYNGPRGPAHPYGLYTQNTVVANETNEPQIPLGFNSSSDSYQRQLGPDGEEAGDLIGPLGHMEELPPYSRYPDNAYVPKDPPGLHPQSQPQSASNDSSSPDRTIAGAGGIGLATRDPEFSSTEDLGLSRSHPSVRSNRSDISHHDINGAAREMTEKPFQTKWQKRAKKKLWGIVPYWAICLLTVGLVIMGIIMGAVIGTLLSRHKNSGDDDIDISQPIPTSADVELLDSYPADLSDMPTGFFGLPPLVTSQAPKTCFNDSTQAQAWSCDIPFSFYAMTVGDIPDAFQTESYKLTLTPVVDHDAKFIWGTQPPNLRDSVILKLVKDPYALGRGPAWYTLETYNKTVIVPEDDIDEIEKRGWSFDSSDLNVEHSKYKKKSMGAQDGDRPWICTWPDTTLEIFIYPNQDSSNPNAGTATVSGSRTAYTSYTYTSSTYSPTPYDETTSWTSTETYMTSPTMSTDSPAETYDTPFEPPPGYPKVIKLLERRTQYVDSPMPSCRQVEVRDGGSRTEDVLDDDGNPVVVYIKDSRIEKMQSSTYQRRSMKRSLADIFGRGQLELTDCGCLWWST